MDFKELVAAVLRLDPHKHVSVHMDNFEPYTALELPPDLKREREKLAVDEDSYRAFDEFVQEYLDALAQEGTSAREMMYERYGIAPQSILKKMSFLQWALYMKHVFDEELERTFEIVDLVRSATLSTPPESLPAEDSYYSRPNSERIPDLENVERALQGRDWDDDIRVLEGGQSQARDELWVKLRDALLRV